MEDSSFGRLIAVLVNPTKTFQSIAARPTVAVALLALLALSTLSMVVALQKVDMAELARTQLESRADDMTPEQYEQAVEFTTKFGSVMFLVGALVFAPIVYLILAAVFMVTLRLLGGELGYKGSLSVLLHGMMPWGVASLVAIPIIFFTEEIDPAKLEGGNLLASNAGVFAPEDASKTITTLLSSLDLFSFWTIALLGIGYALVARVSRGTALGAVIALWVVYVLGRVGMAAAFS